MTRDQILAWLSLAFFTVFALVLALEQLDILSGRLPSALLGLTALAATVCALAITMKRRKGVIADERDRLYGNRSFVVAYFVAMMCLSFGVLVATLYAFPGGSIPLRFLYLLAGLTWAVSMLALAIATVVQYWWGYRHEA